LIATFPTCEKIHRIPKLKKELKDNIKHK